MSSIPVRKIRTEDKPLRSFDTFRIRDLKTLLNGKDMVQDLHRHDFYFILILEKGRGSHSIDFVSYPVRNHAVFVLRPGQVHQLTLNKGSTGYLIEFYRNMFQREQAQLLSEIGAKNNYQPEPNSFKKLVGLVAAIHTEYHDHRLLYQDVIRANMGILLIELLRHRAIESGTGDQAESYAQGQLDKLLNLIETHVSTKKQVPQYADLMNLSPYQLNATTKALLGKTCAQLIDEYVILESKRYLLATSNQVSLIARSLGYKDVSYFIRFFRKHTGHTPDAFRQNFK